MLSTAHFRFEGRLQDFLRHRGTETPYSFRGTPSVKDAIEALGVPHVEAGVIHINGNPSSLAALLHPGDQVTISPDESPLSKPCFVLDVHLGSLARALRLLGFDSLYERNYSDLQIAEIGAAGDRAVLTRDIGLLKYKVLQQGYWLRSQHTEEQVREVLHRYNLAAAIKPFHRCLSCNGIIEPVAESAVRDRIPPRVLGFREEYFRCKGCGKVYWKGTHYDRMLEFIQRVTSNV